jgi:hypothetical protein
VADDEHLDEPGSDDPELTPEQGDAVWRPTENMWQPFASKIDFNLPAIKIPESTLMNISAVSRFAAQYTKLFDSLMPVLAAQDAWKKQIGFLNSDIFKVHAANQAQFSALSAQLTKNLNFGLSAPISKIVKQFAAQQASWLRTLGPTFERLKAAFYPLNLRAIENLDFEDVEKVVMADGIALYGVPRTAVAETLIRADTAAKRREILGRRWTAISADCRAVMMARESDAFASSVPFAVAALDALDSGHTAAAQALAGSLIDSILMAYFGAKRRDYTPSRSGTRKTSSYDEFTIREFIAFAPMWQAYQQFRTEDGDSVPTTFSRNATAHTVSPRQFSRRNAVQGLLFASSLLYFFDEQAKALAA